MKRHPLPPAPLSFDDEATRGPGLCVLLVGLGVLMLLILVALWIL